MLDERFRIVLIRALASLQHSIDKNTDAIREHDNATDETAEPHPPEITRTEVGLHPTINAYYEAEQRERPSRNWWERVKRCIEVFAFFSAVAAAIFTYKTLGQIQRQAAAAQGQLDVMRSGQRPWVGIEQNTAIPVNSPQYAWSPALSYPTIYVTLQYSIKNYGLTPAFRVNGVFTVAPVTDPGPTGGPSFPDPCAMAETRQDPSEKIQLGEVVFPGSAINTGFGTNMQTDPQKLRVLRRVWINLCIAYQDSDKAKWRHSKYTFISSPAAGPTVTFKEHPGWSDLPFTGMSLIAASSD
jgi:hypothetical protein